MSGSPSLAAKFADMVRGEAQEIWLSRTVPNPVVTVVMPESDLEQELSLRRTFIELLRDSTDRPLPELWVYGTDDPIPDVARTGERL